MVTVHAVRIDRPTCQRVPRLVTRVTKVDVVRQQRPPHKSQQVLVHDEPIEKLLVVREHLLAEPAPQGPRSDLLPRWPVSADRRGQRCP